MKPAVFDLLLSAVIASYLALVYLLLQNSSPILSALATLVRWRVLFLKIITSVGVGYRAGG